MAVIVTITEGGDGYLRVRAPFKLREVVKSVASRWDATTKVWVVPPWNRRELVALLEHCGCEVVEPGRKPPRPAQPWAEILLAALPEALRRKAYRALATVLHPDHGGDSEAMKALNRAWDNRQRKAS